MTGGRENSGKDVESIKHTKKQFIIPLRKGIMINIPARKTFFLVGAIFISFAVSFFYGSSKISSFQQDSQERANQVRLAEVLRKSKDYCRRLEEAALDFVCLEEVTERLDRTKEIIQRIPFNNPQGRYLGTETIRMSPKKIESNKYLYDYQFIRKKQETKERRNLVEVNGKKKNIKDTSLHTTMFQYGNILFGPVGLLSESWQPYHDYKLIGEELINGEKAVVIEATPKPMFTKPHCYGKIWVKENDGSVLKIVWDQKSIGNIQIVEERAKKYKAKPQVTSLSEYGFEKNGIRFPSLDFTEEAYIKKDGKKFVLAETTVIYKNYKFFTVETEIRY